VRESLSLSLLNNFNYACFILCKKIIEMQYFGKMKFLIGLSHLQHQNNTFQVQCLKAMFPVFGMADMTADSINVCTLPFGRAGKGKRKSGGVVGWPCESVFYYAVQLLFYSHCSMPWNWLSGFFYWLVKRCEPLAWPTYNTVWDISVAYYTYNTDWVAVKRRSQVGDSDSSEGVSRYCGHTNDVQILQLHADSKQPNW